MTRRNPVLMAFGAMAVLALAMVSLNAVRADQGRAELNEQLRLARTEGLPTTWEEFAATLPRPAPDQNAAPIYQQLHEFYARKGHAGPKATTLAQDAIFGEAVWNQSEGAAFVESFAHVMKLADEANRFPDYRPDRRPSVFLLDRCALDMRDLGRLYSLRGSVAARKGDPVRAIADAHRVFRVARHMGQIPEMLARMLGQTTYRQGVLDLAYWAFTHPDRPEYAVELHRAVANFPDLDLRMDFAGDLLACLDLFDTSMTPRGRQSLGLKDTSVSPMEILLRATTSENKAKAKIVKAEREFWAALPNGTPNQSAKIAAARSHLADALAAYPTASQVILMLLPNANNRLETWPQTKLELTALDRAFSGGRIQRTIRTNDLISPFDGKPLRYHYDGKQMTISLGGAQDLTIPPALFSKP